MIKRFVVVVARVDGKAESFEIDDHERRGPAMAR
jgi:hypothetical protein